MACLEAVAVLVDKLAGGLERTAGAREQRAGRSYGERCVGCAVGARVGGPLSQQLRARDGCVRQIWCRRRARAAGRRWPPPANHPQAVLAPEGRLAGS